MHTYYKGLSGILIADFMKEIMILLKEFGKYDSIQQISLLKSYQILSCE